MSLLCALGTQKTRHQTPQSRTRMIRDIRTPEYLVVVCSDPSRYHVPFASVQYPTHTPCEKCTQLRTLVSYITVLPRYTQHVHDTVHKTSTALYTRLQPTCYSHQHAQRATITQSLRLRSTFSFRSLTCYVFFLSARPMSTLLCQIQRPMHC